MVACAVEHSGSKNLFLSIFEKPAPQPRINVDAVAEWSVPMLCMHCEKAPCIEACPTVAIYKTADGLVLIREEYCIGCKVCVLACPFGVLKVNRAKGVTFKCDLCSERLKGGLNPACVEACSSRTGAIKYTYLEDSMKEVRRERARDLLAGRKIPEKGIVAVKEFKMIKESKLTRIIKPSDVKKMERGAMWGEKFEV